VAGALPCIELRKIEGFVSMAETPQQAKATGQAQVLERANPQRNKN